MNNLAETFYDAAMQRGYILINTHQYERAILVFEEAINAKPRSPEPYYEISKCLANIDKNEKALEILDHAISLDPTNSFPHGMRGWILCNMGRPGKAFEEANLALEKDPLSLLARKVKARSWGLAGKNEECLKASKEVLKYQPRCTYALNLIASAERGLGNIQESREVIAIILHIDPNDHWAHANAGYNALSVFHLDLADGHFRESLRIFPQYGYARTGLLRTIQARFFFVRLYYIPRYYLLFFNGIAFSVGFMGVVQLSSTGSYPSNEMNPLLVGFILISLALRVLNNVWPVFLAFSKSLMNYSHRWDFYVRDLTTDKEKESSITCRNILIVFNVASVFSLYTAIPVMSFTLLYIWAIWPRPQVNLLDLSQPVVVSDRQSEW